MHVVYSPITFNSSELRALNRPRGDQRNWRRLGWDLTTGALNVEGANATAVMVNSSISNALQPWPILLRDQAALFSDNPAHVVPLLLALCSRCRGQSISKGLGTHMHRNWLLHCTH